jgi:hypothetical protein
MSSKIEIRESSIHGLGVFTKEKINTHVLIEGAPVILFHRDSFEDLCVPLESNPEKPVKQWWKNHLVSRHILMDYPFAWDTPFLALGLGYSSVYNHATEDPNALWKPNPDCKTIDIYSRRAIEPEEEITIRYLPYKHCDKLWFLSEGDPDSFDRVPITKDDNDWRDIHRAYKDMTVDTDGECIF